MALDPTQTARLASLQMAYDQLITGSAVAMVQTGGLTGRKVQYGPGDIARLKDEIDTLTALAASSAANPRTRGAVRFRL